MKKTERIILLVKWIAIAPGIDVKTLAILLDLSERGVYRYIADLLGLGVPITNSDGGYYLQDEDILKVVRFPEGDPMEPGAEELPDDQNGFHEVEAITRASHESMELVSVAVPGLDD